MTTILVFIALILLWICIILYELKRLYEINITHGIRVFISEVSRSEDPDCTTVQKVIDQFYDNHPDDTVIDIQINSVEITHSLGFTEFVDTIIIKYR